MDQTAIVHALRVALQSGATLYGMPPDPKSDLSLVTRATNVVIDPRELATFVSVLQTDPDFASLDGKMAQMGLMAGATTINLQQTARLMLAHALAIGDPAKVVAETARALRTNEARALVVMALVGVDVTQSVQLGPSVRLSPLRDLPPSIQRGVALGQEYPLSLARPPTKASAALTTEVMVKPIIMMSDEVTAAYNAKTRQQASDPFALLEEARNCLTLVNLSAPVAHTMWSQWIDLGAVFASGAGWTYNYTDSLFPLAQNQKIDTAEAAAVCGAYFSLPPEVRERALRVPLDRLNRAIRQRSLVDRAIDLGIALEALLLHDISSHTELSYRLRLRGAWLCGRDKDHRRAIFDLLDALYRLRSAAVHRGRLGSTEKLDKKRIDTESTLHEGIATCATLIRTLIAKGGHVDFDSAVFGG